MHILESLKNPGIEESKKAAYQSPLSRHRTRMLVRMVLSDFTALPVGIPTLQEKTRGAKARYGVTGR